MFFLFLAVAFFMVVFLADKMQFWNLMLRLDRPTNGPMIYGPLANLAWKFSGGDIGRFMFFQFLWLVIHIVLIGAVFDYLKLGKTALRPGSGIIPAIILALALAVFYGQLYLRRKRV